MFWIVAFLVVVGVLLPVGAWTSRVKPSAEPPTDAELPSLYVLVLQAVIVHAVTFGLAWMAASAAGLAVPWRSDLGPVALLAAIGVVALAMAVAWLDSKRPPAPHNAVGRVLERAKMSDPALIAMLLSAGLAEEFVYRGVLTSLLAPHLGMVFAAVASALLFGFGHLAQGWKGFVGSACFALAFQGLIWLSGGLMLAIAAHIAYDFGAIWLGRVLAEQRARRG